MMISQILSIRLIGAVLFLLLQSADCGAAPTSANAPFKRIKLQPLTIDPATITVSGVSSGAFMSVQMHVAHSDIISGVGTFAGGIYSCSEGQFATALSKCMLNPSTIDVNRLVNLAKQYESAGRIAKLNNLAKSQIYIFSSPIDQVVKVDAGSRLASFYQTFIPSGQIKTESSVRAAHGWPTLTNGSPCATQGLPWIQNCGFDGGGEMLKSLLPSKLSKPRRELTAAEKGLLERFDQTEFGSQMADLAGEGFVFIPDSCRNGQKCHLHLALHGCQQNEEYTQTQFPDLAGLNEWAVDNDIVVLYPQAKKQQQKNPNACWDWWAYNSKDFAVQAGPQIQFLRKLISRVAAI